MGHGKKRELSIRQLTFFFSYICKLFHRKNVIINYSFAFYGFLAATISNLFDKSVLCARPYAGRIQSSCRVFNFVLNKSILLRMRIYNSLDNFTYISMHDFENFYLFFFETQYTNNKFGMYSLKRLKLRIKVGVVISFNF